MWRALLFIALLGIAASGAVWLADHPGSVTIVWQGREVETSLSVALFAVAVLAVALAIVWAAIRFILRIPARYGRNSEARRLKRGHQALSRGIVAVGAGDLVSARRHAAEAERLVGHEPLALLLRAQTAQASGDRAASESAFRHMLEHKDTRVLGLRGLFLEARRRGDADAARTAAEQALKTTPGAGWASDAVLEAYAADGQWNAAIRAVERRASLGIASREEIRRQRAVLHAADAMAREEAGDPEAALAASQEAIRLAPSLVPSVVTAARLLSRRGDLKKAARLIETAWKAEAHPDLAGAYLNLRPGDSAADRLSRADTLARWSSWSPEARLAIARTAIEARQFERARDALQPLLSDRPTVRTCLLAAELEQAEGRTGGTREWLARAARAPHDKAWVADGIVADHWAPISPVTGKLDAFQWTAPPDMLGRSQFEEHGFLDLAMRASEPQGAEPPAIEARNEIGPTSIPSSIEDQSPRTLPPRQSSVIFPVPHAPDDPGLSPDKDASSAPRD